MSSDIAAEVGPAVQAYQASVSDFDREVARVLGVGSTDLACLELVLGADGVSPRDVATALGLTTGSVTTMVDRLEKRGYVTRHPHPDDGRKVLVRATPRLTLASQALVDGERKADSTSIWPPKPTMRVVCHSTSNSSGSISVSPPS